jgi:hypothetical protein
MESVKVVVTLTQAISYQLFSEKKTSKVSCSNLKSIEVSKED